MRDGQLTLGKLKEELMKCAPDSHVEFAFGRLLPAGFMSYRGDYSHLALGFKMPDGKSKAIAVADLIAECDEANGNVYQGYKGGDFKMHGNTPIWVANYGDSTNTALIGVINKEYVVYLETGYRDY